MNIAKCDSPTSNQKTIGRKGEKDREIKCFIYLCMSVIIFLCFPPKTKYLSEHCSQLQENRFGESPVVKVQLPVFLVTQNSNQAVQTPGQVVRCLIESIYTLQLDYWSTKYFLSTS